MMLSDSDTSGMDDTKLRSDGLPYTTGQTYSLKDFAKHSLWKLIFDFSYGFLAVFHQKILLK